MLMISAAFNTVSTPSVVVHAARFSEIDGTHTSYVQQYSSKEASNYTQPLPPTHTHTHTVTFTSNSVSIRIESIRRKHHF